MRLTITWYHPHYLMFGCYLCLPVDFYFPTMRATEIHWCVDCYVAKLHEWMWKAFKEVQAQSMSKAERQKWYLTGRLMPFDQSPVTWSWPKLMPTEGRAKWRSSGRRDHTKWNTELLKETICMLWRTSRQDVHRSSTKTDFFLIAPAKGTPLCTVMWDEWAWCTTTTLEEQTPEGSEAEEVSQSVTCLPPAQWQTVRTPLGWVSRKLCAFLQMSSGVSLLDQGWNIQCIGNKGVKESTLVFWWWRYWSH